MEEWKELGVQIGKNGKKQDSRLIRQKETIRLGRGINGRKTTT